MMGVQIATYGWSPKTHKLYSLEFKNQVIVLLLLATCKIEDSPKFTETFFYKIPLEILWIIVHKLGLLSNFVVED